LLRPVCSVFVAFAAYAATPIYQASFESPNGGWTAVRGTATLDASVTYANSKSLRIERGGNSPDACVRLAPVTLTVGKR
jgi:hypothetical protein